MLRQGSSTDLFPLILEEADQKHRPRRFQQWGHSHLWDRTPPSLAVGFDDEAARAVLFERERVTGEKWMVTIENAILNWADNIVADGVLHTRFRNDTAAYARGVAAQDLNHGWRVGTGLCPHGEGVAIDARKMRPDVRLSGAVMLATPDEPGNWGLFLLQSLPAALRFVKDRKRYGKFMCHAPPGNRRDLLRLVGIRDADFLYHDVSKTYEIEEVRFFQQGFRDLVVSPDDRALLLSLAESVRYDHKIRNAPNLFLSRRMRSAEMGVYRVLRNELELRHALENIGFESIETEYMGPIDQIRAMAGARVIVGLGGAGMFNTVFCPAGTRVLDIESTPRFTNAHTNIFASCGMNYGVHLGREVKDTARTDHLDWEVNVQEILRSLDFIMKHTLAPRSSVVCRVDRMDKGRVSGWAHDPEQPNEPLKLAVYIDGSRVSVLGDAGELEVVTCSLSRPDVSAAGVGPEASGYTFMLKQAALDGNYHVFELRTLDGQPVKLQFGDGDYDQRMFGHLWQARVLSSVQYVEGGIIKGWVLVADLESGMFRGRQRVSVAWNGRTLGSTIADTLLTEGADDRAVGMSCAFTFDLPQWLLIESKPLLRVYVEPQHDELEGSPLKPVDHGDEQRLAALALYDALTTLQERVTASVAVVRDIALARYPRAAFARWDAEVSTLLAERIKRWTGPPISSERLTVFVIVREVDPTRLHNTLASVAAQTSPGAVVCLVLTGGTALPQQVAEITRQHPSLPCSVLDRKGRSVSWVELANLPPASRQGWCMFLESGDVLRSYAWAMMQAVSADQMVTLVYFDDVGMRGSPQLKPGWNRTLLQNGDLIGRSVVVRSEAIARMPREVTGRLPIGDLLAGLPDAGIRHLAAVLATVAIDDRRPQAEARSDEYPMVEEVEASGGRIELSQTPTVSFLIVEEWQSGELRRCVDLLISQLDYPTYEIVVCCSDLHFAEILGQPLALSGVRLRHVVADGVVDSGDRLSACLRTIETDFVVLISGYILRPKASWLRALLRECLANATVAAVGGKNLDPRGRQRDAGFIKTADGGVAAVGEGVALRALGYLDRFARAQEVSVLAGPAIMFRRSALLAVASFGHGKELVADMFTEICLELVARGSKLVWVPDAVGTCIDLVQTTTREAFMSPIAFKHLANAGSDPFYNPNFSLEQPLFSQLEAPSIVVTRLAELLHVEQPRSDPRIGSNTAVTQLART